MNHIKIQQTLIKAADARDGYKHKSFDAMYFLTDDRVWVCPGSRWVMGIPKASFYLDIDKVFKRAPFKEGGLFSEAENAKPVEDGGLIDKVIRGKKIRLHLFKVDDTTIYVDEDYVKYFDSEAYFKGTTAKAPLFVYELGELVGLILPVYIGDEDD